MCGIAGWIDWERKLSDKKDILMNMTEILHNRGPDANGYWVSEHAAFGHRRLSVVDPEGGSQPMIRSLGDYKYVITYNGELYNTLDLRLDLKKKGYEFYTNSDTEVLLVSYIHWGAECVKRFNGIYAFGIWNEKDQKLFLARDRFGVKPLFYTKRGSSFLFASEIKSLLKNPLVSPDVNAEGIAEILFIGPARTPGHGVFKDIYELKPGFSAEYSKDSIRIEKYWSLVSKEHTDDVDTTATTVMELFRDSVERQLVADVPVCTFLSGGVDSSAITAIAANAFRKNGMDTLHTYSIDYKGNDLYFKANDFQPNSDSQWVRKMSDFLGTRHHYFYVDTPELVESLTDSLRAKDLPGMADIDSSLYLFCKEVKKEATVALSGECADEIFGGYPWFHREDLYNAGTFPWSLAINERKSITSPEILKYIQSEEYIDMRYKETLKEVPKLDGEDGLDARRRELFYLNIYWFMSTLLDRKDRMSMATGLEVRVPYCDHRLVEYVWNIPWWMKNYNGREKGILRKALKNLLPSEVLERKKSPYPRTYNPSYLAAVQGWLNKILDDSTAPIHQLINTNVVRSIVENEELEFKRPWFGQLMRTAQLYAYLIQVNVWLKEYGVRVII